MLLPRTVWAVCIVCWFVTLYTTRVFTSSDNGALDRVIVSNSQSSVTPSNATLTVTTSPQTGHFYVALNGNDSNPGTLAQPFLTIDKARQVVRGLNAAMTGDITVYIRAGEYFLPSTLSFDQLDSGTNGYNIIYKAYPGEKPIISGGQKITGWTSVGGGIYKALSFSSLKFRQLYVSDTRATRARTPNSGSYKFLTSWDESNKQLVVPGNQLPTMPTGHLLNKVEMVIQTYGVVDSKLRIASITTSGSSAYITPMEPERTRVFAQSPYPPHRGNRPYHFENAYEFLDTPGEWYLDSTTNEVFYLPRPGENMALVEVVAPKLETILNVQGTARANVHNLQFYGLTFSAANWLEPDTQGFIEDQACTVWHSVVPLPKDQVTSYPSTGMPAGIHLEYANNIRLERNTIKHFGGSGINLFRGDSYNTLIGNVVTDISGSGICVDLNLQGYLPDTSPKLSPHNSIINNIVAHIGRDYYGAAGIFFGYTNGTIVEHNELFDMPSQGIGGGWGWANVPNAAKNNSVRYNEVYDVMNLISDGAGLYTLSDQPGTVLAENYLHDIVQAVNGGYANNGIFLDEGSNHMSVKDNVCETIPEGCVRLSTTVGRTNTITDNKTVPPRDNASQSIIDNAGLEPAYQDLHSYVPPPPPGISTSPLTLTFTGGATPPPPQSVTVTTVNGNDWNSSGTCSWADATPTTGSGANGGSSQSFTPGSGWNNLATPGTYNCYIRYTSAGNPDLVFRIIANKSAETGTVPSPSNSTPAQSQRNNSQTSTAVISPTPATATYTFTRDLTVGSRGDDVTALQNILVARGYLAADKNTGYFGPLTRAALVSFQRANSIAPALGYFGSLSRARLNAVGDGN